MLTYYKLFLTLLLYMDLANFRIIILLYKTRFLSCFNQLNFKIPVYIIMISRV